VEVQALGHYQRSSDPVRCQGLKARYYRMFAGRDGAWRMRVEGFTALGSEMLGVGRLTVRSISLASRDLSL
jgi:hypothetical protein